MPEKQLEKRATLDLGTSLCDYNDDDDYNNNNNDDDDDDDNDNDNYRHSACGSTPGPIPNQAHRLILCLAKSGERRESMEHQDPARNKWFEYNNPLATPVSDTREFGGWVYGYVADTYAFFNVIVQRWRSHFLPRNFKERDALLQRKWHFFRLLEGFLNQFLIH